MPIVVPLLALDVVVVALWCIALALAIAIVLDHLSAILAGLPWAGSFLSSQVGKMASAISRAAGNLEGGIDSAIGGAWHALANYLHKALDQFVAHSALIVKLAELVGSGIYAVSGLRGIVRAISHVAHAAYSGVKTLEREYHGIEHRVRTIEREIGAGIGNDVRAEVAGLEKAFTGLEKATIPKLRERTKTAEGKVTQLENFIGAIPGTRYLDWAAGIVAAGLGASLFNLFKCPTFLGKTLGRGCGLWNALEDVLGLLADAIIFTDLCQIPVWVNEIFGPIEGFVVGLISDAANAACAQPPSSFVTFSVEPAQLPPANSIGSLPS